MSKLNLRGGVCALGLAVIMAVTAYGQVNTATVTGLTSDPSHAVVPGAHLTIVNQLTGFTKTTVSDDGGRYRLDLLPVGTYTLTVEAHGFQKYEQKEIVLVAAQVLGLDLELRIGTTAQVVTVIGQPLIESDTSSQQSTLTNEEVRQLPQYKLDWAQLMNLGNGMYLQVASTTNSEIPSAPSGNETIAMNGITGEGMSLTLDGTNASSSAVGPSVGNYDGQNVINTVNTDAIKEISISKGITPASAGGTISGNVNLISQSGTNRFHGDGYEVNSLGFYNARNQFLATKPHYVFNQFGGSFAGPIKKDKAFFFGSLEQVRNPGYVAENTSVPSPYFWSLLPTVFQQTKSLYPQQPQPANPTALVSPLVEALNSVDDDLNTTDRFDYYFSQNNQLSARYVFASPMYVSPNIVTANPLVYKSHTNMVNVSFVHTGGNWTSQSRFGFDTIPFIRQAGALSSNNPALLDGAASYSGGTSFAPSAETSGQHGWYWTAMEDISIMRGRHNIQFGGLVQRQNISTEDINTASLSYTVLSDLEANIPDAATFTFVKPWASLEMYQYGAYVLDNIRATPNLTLNLGVRYDLYTVPFQKDGLLFNRGADPVLGPGFGPYLPPSQSYNGDHTHFEPRIGFAWTVGGSRKTVIRGGTGIFVGPSDTFSGLLNDQNASGTVPSRLTFTRAQLLAGNVQYPLTPAGMTTALTAMENAGVVAGFNQLPSSDDVSQNNPNPYTFQWMMNVERELGWGTVLTASYVGNRGLKMVMWEEENLPNRITGVIPDPLFTSFIYVDPIDASTYNALQLQLRKTYRGNLGFTASYTYGRESAYCNANLSGRCYAQDNNNIRSNLGGVDGFRHQNFNASYVYRLPLQDWTHWHGQGSGILIGGWQASGIITALTGPYVSISNPLSGDGYPADRSNVVPGVSPYNPNWHQTGHYLNFNAFAEIAPAFTGGPAATPGNSIRDGYVCPGLWNWDSSFGKYFHLTEKLRLQFHGDLFNTLNHTNPGGLSTKYPANSATSGEFTSAVARTVQFGARLEF